jgi:hypothetical protein
LNARAGTSKGKEVADDKSLPRKSEGIYGIEDAWKQVVASSPHLRGVDDRAEEFISKLVSSRYEAPEGKVASRVPGDVGPKCVNFIHIFFYFSNTRLRKLYIVFQGA